MIKESATESIADFIQGRAATTVGSAHYRNKVKKANQKGRNHINACSVITLLKIRVTYPTTLKENMPVYIIVAISDVDSFA